MATLVSPTATASTEEGVTSARIVGYSPDSVVDVDLGQTVALTATILNTGTLTQRFDVVVTISRPDGRTLETLRTSLAAALDPESQRTVAWEYVVSEPGDFLVGFVVKGGGTAAQDIVLDRAPPEPQRLIFGRPSPTPTATIAPVVPGPQPSPTPTQVVVVIPPAIPTPTPAPTATPVAPGIDAEVVGFSPANLVNVDVGETVGLSATIANRGSVGRQFLVGATVTNSGGDLIADYTTTLGVTLESNEQAVVAWDHPVTGPGNFAVQFSVWENEPGTDQNLLDREPSTAQTLITATVAAVSTPTALPTPTVVPTPSATRTPSPTATMVPAPPVVLADVTSHSPSTAQLIQQGQTVGLSMEVQNKGSSQWNFEVRARIERLDGTFVAEYVDVSGVVLPGQSTTFAWSHTATNVGDLYLRFEASRSGSFSGDDLLDSVPDAPGVLIRVLSF